MKSIFPVVTDLLESKQATLHNCPYAKEVAMRKAYSQVAPYLPSERSPRRAARLLRAFRHDAGDGVAINSADSLRPRALDGDVRILLGFLRLSDSEPLIAVAASEQELEAVHDQLPRHGDTSALWWQELPLQQASTSHAFWPNPDQVHIVGEGGLDNNYGDTGFDLQVLAVFTDLRAASEYAQQHSAFQRALVGEFGDLSDDRFDNITLRTVQVGVILPYSSNP